MEESFFSDSLGQAAAPFELLVAMIVMGFVIIVGTMMLTNVDDQVCMNHVEDEMSEFVTNLEETANKRSTNKFIFYPKETCFNRNEHTMKITRQKGSDVCAAKCEIPQDTCYVMTFYTPEVAEGFREKCLNLPAHTNFTTSEVDCPTTDEFAGYDISAQIPEKKLPFGSYILRNVAKAGETWPSVCFYYKK